MLTSSGKGCAEVPGSQRATRGVLPMKKSVVVGTI